MPTKTPNRGGKLNRSETVTVRLDQRLRYLAELAARKERRTLSSFVEAAVELVRENGLMWKGRFDGPLSEWTWNTAQQQSLRDLCDGIEEPTQTRGRPRLPLGDMVFAAGFKVYSTVSARRFMSDLRVAHERGLIGSTPHYNSIFNAIESETLTPILYGMIEASARPLKEVESDFAVDSTGFGTDRKFNYYSTRYERKIEKHDWLKAHAMVGVKTNIVTAVKVTHRNDNDFLQMRPLVAATAKHFDLREVSADKAYLGRDNLELIAKAGAAPFIPFKSDSRGDGHHPLWNKLFHFFSFNREEFLAHYHKRSNVEATFSAIKRVFGDSVRSRTSTAQVNEVLLKIVAHNIRCLIHAIHELDLAPMFDRIIPQRHTPAQQVLGW